MSRAFLAVLLGLVVLPSVARGAVLPSRDDISRLDTVYMPNGGQVTCSDFVNAVFQNLSFDDSSVVVSVSHPFLAVHHGIVSGVTYSVTLEPQTDFSASRTSPNVILTSAPAGLFTSLPPGATLCNDTVVGTLSPSFSLSWAPAAVEETQELMAAAFRNDRLEWTATRLELPWRQGCFYAVTTSSGFLSSSDFSDACDDIRILLQGVRSSGVTLEFQELYIPAPGGTVTVRDKSESSVGHRLGNTTQKSELQFTGDFLLISATRCRACSFRVVYYPADDSTGCNRTLRAPEGTINSVEFSHRSADCVYHISAPQRSKIVLVLHQVFTRNPCDREYVAVENVTSGGAMTLCGNVSSTEKFTSIGDSLVLRFHRDRRVQPGQFLLSYVFIDSCDNQTSSEVRGTICSPGFPDIFLDAHCFYTITVPLGYLVDLVFTALATSGEERSTASCAGNFVEVDGADSPVRLCGNWTNTNETLAFRSRGNVLSVRTFTERPVYDGVGFCATYQALVDNGSLAGCQYGWVSGDKYCYRLFRDPVSWDRASSLCRDNGGHLASVTSEAVGNLIDAMIASSGFDDNSAAYWIGAHDRTYENCFEWSDGQPFSYTNWFPGWTAHNRYNAQPSDDGLSDQDCVELRALYRYPSKGTGRTERLYWNDRDCDVSNYFVCQRPRPGVVIETARDPDCNRSIILGADRPSDVISSPYYPEPYPTNAECHFDVSAPEGYRIKVLFTDFLLEEHDSCQYDYLELAEDNGRTRHCGDWQRRMKLLRHISRGNRLHLTFVSDFSHSYKGFRAEVALISGLDVTEYARSTPSVLCDSKLFRLFENDCYLVATYPEVSWATARRICEESQARLATVDTPREERFLNSLVRSTESYMSGVIYWLGLRQEGHPTRHRGSIPTTSGKVTSLKDPSSKMLCQALQWSHTRNTSDLRATMKSCNHAGRYICKKPAIVLPENLNRTVADGSGTFMSVNFPSHYINNLHYTVKIEAAPLARVIVSFGHLDLEWQEECLYDYVLLQNHAADPGTRLCGEHERGMERLTFVSDHNEAYVTFHSDFSVTASGFLATWDVVDVSTCAEQQIAVLDSGSFANIRYPHSYLPSLDCSTTFLAPAGHTVLMTFVDFDVGRLDPQGRCSNDYVSVLLDDDLKMRVNLCGNTTTVPPGLQLVSYGEKMTLLFHSTKEQGKTHRGFNVTFQTWSKETLEAVVMVSDSTRGYLSSINYPHPPPDGANFTIRVVASLGYRVQLNLPVWAGKNCSYGGLSLEDKYANSELWTSCGTSQEQVVWSAFNTLYLHSWTVGGGESAPVYNIPYRVFKDNQFVNTTLALTSDLSIDSCAPNPCLNGGICIRDESSAIFRCSCLQHFTGLFCHLTWCDLRPCGDQGICNLTSNGYFCECLSGYTGRHCQVTITPCNPNPCEANGKCSIVNSTFSCKCQVWYEGPRCEQYVFRIPYKPLSQRMLEEPFWLGLITVSAVLLLILCVYCIKRKFADKIEKLLADEIERSKYNPSPPTTRYSLSSNQPSITPASQSPQSCPKSLLSRIRKHSIRSGPCSASPSDREYSRTFSFDDILRRVHSSSKRSSPSANDNIKKEEEKSRILASLVTSNKSPTARRMSLDEFFRMSERKMQMNNAKKEGGGGDFSDNASDVSATSEDIMETSFISRLSPRFARHSAPSFTEFNSIREQSMEYASSSDSVNGEPNTSEVKADISPAPQVASTPTDKESATPPPQISITVDEAPCEITAPTSPTEDCEAELMDTPAKVKHTRTSSPTLPQKRIYLGVPDSSLHPQKLGTVVSHSEPSNVAVLSLPKQEKGHVSPKRSDLSIPRKYSVELPMPKILITANMSSCESDEASPPRTPNPAKSMSYLSPLTIINSATDRTISESNLSTSGYSSISSPGLSRCNSSSPISDDVEHHNCINRKQEVPSPNKLTVPYSNETSFCFPPPIVACHCQEASTPKVDPASGDLWRPLNKRLQQEKERLRKRNSYQTTSTDESIDDEGIGMDAIDFKIRKGELKSAKDLEVYMKSGLQEQPERDTSSSNQLIPKSPSGLLLAPSFEFPTPSANKSITAVRGSPRPGTRKGDKSKKYSEKHRRSPVTSPATSPVELLTDSQEGRLPRNSSRTNVMILSSESDDPDNYVGPRQKSQTRRVKKQEVLPNPTPKQSSHPTAPSKNAGYPSPYSESNGESTNGDSTNGDSAQRDSRSLVSSSSESLPSTSICSNCDRCPSGFKQCIDKGPSNLRNLHLSAPFKRTLERTRSSPVSRCSLHQQSVPGVLDKHQLSLDKDPPRCVTDTLPWLGETRRNSGKRFLPLTGQRTHPMHQKGKRVQSMDSVESSVPSDSDDESSAQQTCKPLIQTPTETHHPGLRRQEALAEDDGSDDSSSETTVLLRRPAPDGLQAPGKGSLGSTLEVPQWTSPGTCPGDVARSVKEVRIPQVLVMEEPRDLDMV